MENHLFQARFGRPGAFVAALQKLRGKGTDISEEAKEIKVPKKKLSTYSCSTVSSFF
jgi:MFS transporter, SP family, ERD6-like sugar transporter